MFLKIKNPEPRRARIFSHPKKTCSAAINERVIRQQEMQDGGGRGHLCFALVGNPVGATDSVPATDFPPSTRVMNEYHLLPWTAPYFPQDPNPFPHLSRSLEVGVQLLLAREPEVGHDGGSVGADGGQDVLALQFAVWIWSRLLCEANDNNANRSTILINLTVE